MKKEIAMKYNRRIFPIYKGFAWDPLFYSAIIFLFLTEVKGIEASQVMYAEAMYCFFLILFQIPANIIIERLGSRRALILGNTFIAIKITMIIFINHFFGLVFAYFISAFGDAIKGIGRNTILYDSTKICIGKNSFGNVNARGSSVAYALSALSKVITGYLYLINPYVPLILASLTSLLTILIAYRFEELETENVQKTTISDSIQDIKQGFGFILRSRRLQALFLFLSIFYGIIDMIMTYENNLLADLKIAPQYFCIIFAMLTLVQCFSVKYQDKLHNTFKNKTLTVIAIPILLSFIIIGIVTNLNLNFYFTLTIVMIAFIIHHFFRGPYWVLEDKYLTNFTTNHTRAKILSTNNFIKNSAKMLISFLGGLLLDFYSTSISYLIVGMIGLIVISLILNYMKTRVGLNPEEYSQKDIELL